MTDFKIAPFGGIDTHTPEPSATPGLLRDAVNVDIDRDGGVGRRDGLQATAVTDPVSGVYGWRNQNRLCYVSGGSLKLWNPATGVATTLGAVTDTEVEYVEVNSELVVGGLNTLLVVRSGQVQGLGVETPPPPLAATTQVGGFTAGRYGVLITFVASSGEESGASPAVFFDVVEGGGIEIQALPIPLEAKVTKIRIYRTTANGDAFYAAQDLPLPHAGAFLLSQGAPGGQVCTTRHMVRMPGGKYLRYWRGRVLVARGPNLYMSEPMRYGLHDPRHGFIQFPNVITFIQPVLGGIFIGQRDGVVFLRGALPSELKVEATGAAVPVPGSSTEIGGEDMSGDWAQGGQKYAVWLGERGYAIGTPNGDVVEPQSKRLAVPVGQRGVTVVHNRRLTTLVT